MVGPAGGRRQTEQWIRRKPGRLRIEYLAPPGVRGEVLVDDGEEARLYRPRLGVVEEGPSQVRKGEQQKATQIRQLERGRLLVNEEPSEAVAGRPVRVFSVTAPNGRARRLWIDRERAVILKVQEMSAQGQTVTTAFTQVDYSRAPADADFILNLPPGTISVPAGLGRPIPLPRAQQLASEWGGLYRPAALPGGFALRAAYRTQINRTPVVALLYSNGQQSFTLFQGRAAGMQQKWQDRRLRARQRVLSGVTFTIVGPLPEAELERILNSVGR